MTRVYFTGKERIKWAVDEDLIRTKRALNFVQEVSLDECDVVHAAYWTALLNIPVEKLRDKRVLCHLQADPFEAWSDPSFKRALGLVSCWIVRSNGAAMAAAQLGLRAELVPYIIDQQVFFPISRDVIRLQRFAQEYGIPRNAYLIGSFQRDTEGRDLKTAKFVKGPDLLFSIVSEVYRRYPKVHLVLAGPRRHWIRKRLSDFGIPYTFVGSPTERDDLDVNIIPQEQIVMLYNLIDLYFVSSRAESGPQAILEAAATRCKIISSRVGHADDVLHPDCLFDSPVEAVQRIEADLISNTLSSTLDANFEALYRHQMTAVRDLWRKIYDGLDALPPVDPSSPKVARCALSTRWFGGRTVPMWKRVAIRVARHALSPRWFERRTVSMWRRVAIRLNRPSISIWHDFHRPPWGGANQFLLALAKAFRRLGVNMYENRADSRINGYILNSIWFNVDEVQSIKRYRTPNSKVIHRIDGPISLVRGTDRELDDLCFELNSELADATVFQSRWSFVESTRLGYQPRNPYIVSNAVDPDIFNTIGRDRVTPHGKIRLISTSWSDNMRKGFKYYQWLDSHLDWDRFEYTFVGRSPIEFARIRHIPPQSSERLAAILKQHDIYITASQDDPASNAVLEALACGLPVVYLKSGGHPELVEYGGLGFETPEEILNVIVTVLDNYRLYQQCIRVPSIEDIARKYLEIILNA